MSIGGNPPTPGSITLNNTVENAVWKSSSNATAQAINTIKLNGTTIWTKPDLQIVQNNLSYNHETEKVTISVTRPTLINSWKYKINSGSLSSAQTSNSISISRSSFNNGQNNTVTVYGYRDGVLKGNSVAKTILVNQNNTLSGTATWNRNNNTVSLSVTLGSSLTGWTYQVGSGSQVNGSGTTASFSDSSNGAKTVTFRGFVNSTQKNSTTASYTVAVPSISCTATGGEEQITISVSSTNHISTDKWQYKIDSGSYQTGDAIGTTSKVVTGVAVGTRSVQVRLLNSGGTALATSAAVSTTVQAAYVPPVVGTTSTGTNKTKSGTTVGTSVKVSEFNLAGIGKVDVGQEVTVQFTHTFGDFNPSGNHDDDTWAYVRTTTTTRKYESPKNANYFTNPTYTNSWESPTGSHIYGPFRGGGVHDCDDDCIFANGGGQHLSFWPRGSENNLVIARSSSSGEAKSLWDLCQGKSVGATANAWNYLWEGTTGYQSWRNPYSAQFTQGGILFYGGVYTDDGDWECPTVVFFVADSDDKLSLWVHTQGCTMFEDGHYSGRGKRSGQWVSEPWVNRGDLGIIGTNPHHQAAGNAFFHPFTGWTATAKITAT